MGGAITAIASAEGCCASKDTRAARGIGSGLQKCVPPLASNGSAIDEAPHTLNIECMSAIPSRSTWVSPPVFGQGWSERVQHAGMAGPPQLALVIRRF